MSDTNSVLLGFGLSLAAGLSTCFGSLAPYMTDLKNTRFLAASLAISAGVMLYVSFAEIIFKARDFMEESMSDAGAAWLSTFCFFLGIALCWALNEMAHRLEEWERNRNGDGQSHLLHDSSQESDAEIGSSHEMTTRGENVDSETQFDGHTSHRSPASNLLEVGEHDPSMKLSEERSKELRTMGLMTALAIAIHNFPEGIATYVAAQADASLGIAMAVAIALHNIPEGVCVSIPIYYATGNIKDALKWSFLSGISEPLGALLGWLVLENVFTPVAYGVLFGLVGGMMVYLCLGELIPTALSFSNSRKFVTMYVVIGMVLMSISLLLLEL